MTLVQKIDTYLRAIETADNLDDAKRDARLARRLIARRANETEREET